MDSEGERAAVVAFLRKFAHDHLFDNAVMSGLRAAAVLMAADAIERGDHLPTKDQTTGERGE